MKRRVGIWVANGTPSNVSKMLSWRPGALTCIYEYLGYNRIAQYKAQHPDTVVVVRFLHPKNWHRDARASARDYAQRIAEKWPELRDIDPYV